MKRVCVMLFAVLMVGCSKEPEVKVIIQEAPRSSAQTPARPTPPVAQTSAQKIAEDEQRRIQQEHQKQIQAQRQEQIQAQRQVNAPQLDSMRSYEQYRDNVYEGAMPGYKAQKEREAVDRKREAEWRAKGAEDRRNLEDYNAGFETQNPNPQRPSTLPFHPR